jgi:hypothetical protein
MADFARQPLRVLRQNELSASCEIYRDKHGFR